MAADPWSASNLFRCPPSLPTRTRRTRLDQSWLVCALSIKFTLDILSLPRSIYRRILSTSLSPRLSLANHAVDISYHHLRHPCVNDIVPTVNSTPCPPGIRPRNLTLPTCESEPVCLNATITEVQLSQLIPQLLLVDIFSYPNICVANR